MAGQSHAQAVARLVGRPAHPHSSRCHQRLASHSGGGALSVLRLRRRYAFLVLYVAREDEPARHRGVVFRLQDSAFAPPEHVRRCVRPGTVNVDAFRVEYLRYLRALWRNDPEAFLGLIERATGGADLTLTDAFGAADYAPRRILAAALKQLAQTRRDEAWRQARRSAG